MVMNINGGIILPIMTMEVVDFFPKDIPTLFGLVSLILLFQDGPGPIRRCLLVF